MTTAPILHLEKFKTHPFLNGLAAGHLAALEESAMEVSFAPNDFIFFEGHPADRFYLILNGSIVLRENKSFPFQIVHSGGVLGWSALFPPYVSHFDAQALTSVKAIFFYGTWVLDQCEMNGDFGYEVMKRMGKILIDRLQARRQAPHRRHNVSSNLRKERLVMNTTVNNRLFLKWHKCKAWAVRSMELIACGLNDGYMTPYGDFPGASSFDVFKSNEKTSKTVADSSARGEGLSKPEVRSEPRCVYEAGIVGGAADIGLHDNIEATTKLTAAHQKLAAKKTELDCRRLDETEATVWVFVVAVLLLVILATVVFEMKIAR